jgi:hypothetical protein
VRNPGAGIDLDRDARRSDRADAFLEVTGRMAIRDQADIDPAAMGADRRGGDAGACGEGVGVD